MGNSFDTDPRGSTDRKLGVIGICFAVVAAIAAVLMVAKSQGLLDKFVRVDLTLVNVGDGLPERSDVKFRGVIVGMVSGINPSKDGEPNIVHVNIQPKFADQIPNNVTARVVPANIFAVSAVQLVQNGAGDRPIATGDVIHEDQTLPTVLFQNVLAKLRGLLSAVGRGPDSNTVGVFAAFSEATNGRGEKLTDAGRDLNEIMKKLNQVVASDDNGPNTIAALQGAAESLRIASPDLFAALDSSVRPMKTFVEKRNQLTSFLNAGLNTTGTLAGAFENQSDRMIQVTTGFAPAIGVLADHADEFHGVSTRLQVLANKLYDEVWDPVTNLMTIKAIVAMNPSRQYYREDCPRYGAMAGPSCQTAPERPTAPDLRPGAASMGMGIPPWVTENRPNFAPPRGSVPPVPEFPGPPGAVDPNAPAAPAPGGAPLPAEAGAPTPAPGIPPLPAEAGAPAAAVQPQSASYGGTVGSVGSPTEKAALSAIVGGPASSATELLLGPVVRGAEVNISPLPAEATNPPEGQR